MNPNTGFPTVFQTNEIASIADVNVDNNNLIKGIAFKIATSITSPSILNNGCPTVSQILFAVSHNLEKAPLRSSKYGLHSSTS